MTIIVFAPHPDDEVLGTGGLLARAAAAGERTVVVIFSAGIGSHPLHKEHLITRRRDQETKEAHKVLGVSECVQLKLRDSYRYFGDGLLKQEIIDHEIIPRLHDIVKNEKHPRLFIPAIDDIHSDHKAVAHAAIQMHVQYALSCPVYTYTIWNPLAIFRRSKPRLVVDISDVQAKKAEAYKAYRSQWLSMYQIVPLVTIRTFLAGMRYGYRWAEVYLQVK
jgi:LmbE family N-acetylglucosaminyl deacetylase